MCFSVSYNLVTALVAIAGVATSVAASVAASVTTLLLASVSSVALVVTTLVAASVTTGVATIATSVDAIERSTLLVAIVDSLGVKGAVVGANSLDLAIASLAGVSIDGRQDEGATVVVDGQDGLGDLLGGQVGAVLSQVVELVNDELESTSSHESRVSLDDGGVSAAKGLVENGLVGEFVDLGVEGLEGRGLELLAAEVAAGGQEVGDGVSVNLPVLGGSGDVLASGVGGSVRAGVVGGGTTAAAVVVGDAAAVAAVVTTSVTSVASSVSCIASGVTSITSSVTSVASVAASVSCVSCVSCVTGVGSTTGVATSVAALVTTSLDSVVVLTTVVTTKSVTATRSSQSGSGEKKDRKSLDLHGE